MAVHWLVVYCVITIFSDYTPTTTITRCKHGDHPASFVRIKHQASLVSLLSHSLPFPWHWWSSRGGISGYIGTSAAFINSVINCFMVKMNILFSVVAEPHYITPPLFSRMEIGLNLISCNHSATITHYMGGYEVTDRIPC